MTRTEAALLLLLLSLSLNQTAAAECLHYEDYLRCIGNVATPDQALDLAVAGDYAFVADYDSGLQIIDIADPTAPAIVGSIDTPGRANDVIVSGHHAFVACWSSGRFLAVDVSDPHEPWIAGVLELPNYVNKLDISGNYAYVAGDYDGLYVLDISDPAAPSIAAFLETEAQTDDVAVMGDHAFIAANGLLVVDISDPLAPHAVGWGSAGSASVVSVADGFAYVGHGIHASPGLKIFDVSDPSGPVEIVALNMPAEATNIAVSGERAYVAAYQSRLLILDVSDPSTPKPLGSPFAAAYSSGVAVAGDLLFVTDWHTGLHVIEPALPPLLGAVDTPGIAHDVTVSGQHAFIADMTEGLQIIDISDPSLPELVASLDLHPFPSSVAISDGIAYVGCSNFTDGSLEIVDVGDPADPVQLGSVEIGGRWFVDVAVAGNHAFVADYDEGLRIVDVSDPTAPWIVGTLATPSACTKVALAGARAYLADRDAGLQVVDVSDPEQPWIVSAIDVGYYNATSVAVAGNLVCLGSSYDGSLSRGVMSILDVSDPASPSEIGSLNLGFATWDVHMVGRHAYVASGSFGGLQVVDIAEPTAPHLIGSSGRSAYGVCIAENEAYLASGRSGLSIMPVQCGSFTAIPENAAASALLQLQIHPNPFNPGTRISFSLAKSDVINLEIFDVRGRRIESLLSGETFPAGSHEVGWDAGDAQGRALSSGVYFCRLQGSGDAKTARLILLK